MPRVRHRPDCVCEFVHFFAVGEDMGVYPLQARGRQPREGCEGCAGVVIAEA